MTARTALDDAAWLGELAQPGNPLSFALFGYDTVSPDWEFRQRVLSDHLMYLITEGSCVGEIDGSPLALQAGSYLWMQPGVRHTFSLGPVTPLTVYFIRFRLHRDSEELALTRRSFQQWEGAWELVELADQLVDELSTRLPYHSERVRGLLVSLCGASLRQEEFEGTSAGAGSLSRAQRRALEAFVRTNLPSRPGPGDLADHIRLSHDYFTRLFTRTFGVPPRVWLVQERLRRGARSLADSLQSISEIARSLGYDDVSAFSHQFRQRYGVSPRAYRQQQR